MGLATSQVRLLALTSRKSDVEFNMQLNAKRKTMLMRESTTLSKLYYAKLQQARYQYSTEEGYNDVTYGYIMGAKNSNIEPTIEQIKNDENGEYFTRNCPGAFVIDANANVVVNDDLFKAIITGWNDDPKNTESYMRIYKTIESLMGDEITVSDINPTFYSNFEAIVRDVFRYKNELKEATSARPNDGYYYYDGSIWYCQDNNENKAQSNDTKIATISKDTFNKMARLYTYYGDMLKYILGGTSLKLAGDLQASSGNKYKVETSTNTEYEKLLNTDYLQEAFRSGTFTLSTLEDNKDYTQGLDYFINKSYFVEKADTESRETITAWFNAKKAELDEKETYWDSEINALSTELETINTEMESIKSLRDNAIQTTFKWGAA